MSKQFSALGINSQLQKSLADLEITSPTDIQQKTIPVLLQQKDDFVGLAKTGTGKTAAFGLPLLQLIDVENASIQAVIIAPTRELGNNHSLYTSIYTSCDYCPNKRIGPADLQ